MLKDSPMHAKIKGWNRIFEEKVVSCITSKNTPKDINYKGENSTFMVENPEDTIFKDTVLI